MTYYWWLVAILVGELILVLRKLHRLKEWHHGYYGAILALLPWWPLRVIGLILLVDDLYQHFIQAQDKEDGRRVRQDFSPLHRAYVWFYRLVH